MFHSLSQQHQIPPGFLITESNSACNQIQIRITTSLAIQSNSNGPDPLRTLSNLAARLVRSLFPSLDHFLFPSHLNIALTTTRLGGLDMGSAMS
jgi:hypothetical protein